MSWVYPNATLEAVSWYPVPPELEHHQVVQEGDEEYIYTPPLSYGNPGNRVRFSFPASCTTCAIRVARGASYDPLETVSLTVRFRSGLFTSTWTIDLMQQGTDYITHTYTPPITWQEIELQAISSEPAVFVSELRGLPIPLVVPTRRLLTGVGI